MKTEQMKLNLDYNRLELKNTDTGEVIGNTLLKTDGSEEVVIDIKNKNKIEGYKKKSKEIREMSEFIQSNEGSYIHLIYKYCYPIFDKIQTKCGGNKSNIHIIRFIVLATYTTFGGKLFDNNKNRIKRSSLKTIWNTSSKNSIKETYDLLIECGYIFENEEGYIMINQDLIVKGVIDDFKNLHKQDSNLTYTRLFSKNIQDMYEGTEPKSRKQLANLFKILPFVNFKYNVFCSNPTETDETKLMLYTWTDLARLCSENEKNVTRFKKDLMKLRVYGFEVIGQFETGSGKSICINPKVYYSGADISEVKHLYSMFRMCDKLLKN
ncbi:hypothetical protein [Paraclostridium sordellii]|uniref:hypothetical protein n=1 Tax=Paraclostridium sordellii TaxID=1505 RepID=UPI00189919C4|nr:hypothetical protein [Paeniclostridium sordellii]